MFYHHKAIARIRSVHPVMHLEEGYKFVSARNVNRYLNNWWYSSQDITWD